MKCCFSLDDYCWQYRDCILYLNDLNNYFNNFKISLFTIPCFERVPLSEHKEVLNLDFKHEHILHGYYHSTHEFEYLNEWQASDYIMDGVNMFIDCNIELIDGFKAPNWRYGNGTIEALKKHKLWLATYRHEDIDGLRTYDWNWDIGDTNIPFDNDIIHAHGHTHSVSGPGKGIQESMDNIKRLPKDINFMFISEFMK